MRKEWSKKGYNRDWGRERKGIEKGCLWRKRKGKGKINWKVIVCI